MIVVEAVRVVDHRETVCGLGCRSASRSNRGRRPFSDDEEQVTSGRQKRDNIFNLLLWFLQWLLFPKSKCNCNMVTSETVQVWGGSSIRILRPLVFWSCAHLRMIMFGEKLVCRSYAESASILSQTSTHLRKQ